MPPRGYALLVSVICGWGLAWPLIKIGLNEIPPLAYRGLMLPVAGIVTLLLARLLGEHVRLPTGQWAPFLISTFLNITCWVLFSTLGLRLMGSGHASIIAYSMPLWAMLCAILFTGERPTPLKIAGLVVGLVGLGILLSGAVGVLAESPLGVALMLVAAVCWGAGTVIHKRIVWRLEPLTLTGWMILIGSLPILLIALTGEVWTLKPISATAAWSVLFVLLIPTIFCWFAWFRVVAMAPVAVSTVGIMMVPVMAVVGGSLILNEAIGARELAALGLVVLAIALVLMPQRHANSGTKP
jgi:drug/metabolite transporter (DMT)-like permease